MNFTVKNLIEITGAKLLKGEVDNTLSFEISTDTRNINSTKIFLPLIGEKFDGHNFIENACNDGVIAYFTQKEIVNDNAKFVLLVDDTKIAYLKIANYYKNLINPKTIAITGSAGKTTTKEIAYHIFKQRFCTHKSELNHNNEIGLAQTLLSMPKDTQILIVEMGMRALGEIDLLAKYAEPDIALITNAGTAHIGILGSRENIAKAKCEITNYLKPENYLIAHNEELIKKFAKGNFNKIFYDLDEIKIIEKTKDLCKFEYDNFVFTISDSADFNILNALASIKAAKLENYTNEEIQKGLFEFQNIEFRNEITKLHNGAIIISDCYNANPDSAKASIKHVCEVYKDKKIIIVFGDMFELGEFEEQYHREIGKLINELNVNYFVSVGKLAKIASEEVDKLPKKICETNEEAAAFLPTITDENTIIFLKASRGMSFEKILEMIKEK